jgi:hypothetical protein
MSRDENEKKIFVSCDQPSYDGVGDAITLGHATAYVRRDRQHTGSHGPPRGNRRHAQPNKVGRYGAHACRLAVSDFTHRLPATVHHAPVSGQAYPLF